MLAFKLQWQTCDLRPLQWKHTACPAHQTAANKDNNDHTLKIPLCPVCSVATTVQPLITLSGIIVLTFDYSETALLFLPDSAEKDSIVHKHILELLWLRDKKKACKWVSLMCSTPVSFIIKWHSFKWREKIRMKVTGSSSCRLSLGEKETEAFLFIDDISWRGCHGSFLHGKQY